MMDQALCWVLCASMCVRVCAGVRMYACACVWSEIHYECLTVSAFGVHSCLRLAPGPGFW